MSDLRQKVLKSVRAGDCPTDIAKCSGLARSTVCKVKKAYEETGNIKVARARQTEVSEDRCQDRTQPSTLFHQLARVIISN